MKTIAFYKHKPDIGVGIFRHVGYDDNQDFLFDSLLPTIGKPFSVRKVDVDKNYDKLDSFDVDEYTKDRTTCRGRSNSFSDGRDITGMDYFVQYREPFPQCSYCGSCKYELLLDVINKVNNDIEGYGIEKATGKNYKYYLTTPECSHGIKFYTDHIPLEVLNDDIKLKELNDKLIPACKKSWERFMVRLNKPTIN